jgi:hypothetical protein
LWEGFKAGGNGEVFMRTVLSRFSPLSTTVEGSLTPDQNSQQRVLRGLPYHVTL